MQSSLIPLRISTKGVGNKQLFKLFKVDFDVIIQVSSQVKALDCNLAASKYHVIWIDW